MKTRRDVTPEKLRGGFYTPPDLVDFCLRRIIRHLGDRPSVLEPSIGDGAFVRGLAAIRGSAGIGEVVGIEPFEIEAEKARGTLSQLGVPGEVVSESAVPWASRTHQWFDVAVGNPPFVRYQFGTEADKAAAPALANRLGINLAGVSNLWIPVLLGALGRVRQGGAFAFVVPTECLTGCSARTVRSWLIANCVQLRFDLFEPGSFPGVLQEVAVLSGLRGVGSDSVQISDHAADGESRSWVHAVSAEASNWMPYLLSPAHLAALGVATSDRRIVPLGSVARFEVSTVTGANDFFTVSSRTADEHRLGRWKRPLLPRIRHAEGLAFRSLDHEQLAASEARAWLLDFSKDKEPTSQPDSLRYVRSGEERDLDKRYKCRIRDPWYRVPCVRPGELLLSKRSHRFPRMVTNEAGVSTTDTIYQGRLLGPKSCTPRALAAGFHNSLTLLTAELEGRSFGGGVLELVPSEIARLKTPVLPSLDSSFGKLDALYRQGAEQDLVDRTDHILVNAGLLGLDVLTTLREARAELLGRRLERNRKSPGGSQTPAVNSEAA